jgi:hypothetical protein
MWQEYYLICLRYKCAILSLDFGYRNVMFCAGNRECFQSFTAQSNMQ